MPIKIPDDLPAARTLQDEGIVVMREQDAVRQDVRPLRIALLNLMPKKIETETQIARVIGATPLQVEMTLVALSSYVPTNTPQEHMLAFYKSWEEVREEKYDGLIVTGAPVEELPFEDVLYWDELRGIFDWATHNVHSSFNICWGAQAALYHYHGVPKYALPKKLSGVFNHRVVRRTAELVRGFNDVLAVPVSRYTENRNNLEILIESDEAGICLVEDHALNAVYMFNHLEYDSRTLFNEYMRDRQARPDTVQVPENYFPGDDPAKTPRNMWRAHGHLLFQNWINAVYQTSPFEIDRIGNGSRSPGSV